VPPVADRGLE
jgi:hypothetical protein